MGLRRLQNRSKRALCNPAICRCNLTVDTTKLRFKSELTDEKAGPVQSAGDHCLAEAPSTNPMNPC